MDNLTRPELQALKSSFEKQIASLFQSADIYKDEVTKQNNALKLMTRFSKSELGLLYYFKNEVKKRKEKITKLSKIQKKIKKALT